MVDTSTSIHQTKYIFNDFHSLLLQDLKAKKQRKRKKKIKEIEKKNEKMHQVLQAEDFCKNSPFTSTLLQPTLNMISWPILPNGCA